MRRFMLIMAILTVGFTLAGCATRKCEVEPIVEENHKLIVPTNFGQMPK